MAWFGTGDCIANGRVFYVCGGEIHLMSGWVMEPGLARNGTWTVEELAQALPPLLR